ncbi:hypothetical protein PAAG_12235 [Paracoccidioides lutzii Pb01]|uniref:Uncharacterized protein n=1 Tax=Paracoccidioides lutzii (strain ATCC MYA-826 / Pb01) TaxID=502779 RepID=A0A0A2V420_PARBA|nr:hypothetical protein PAAG_12235 [Paracoccidioides lutzii Pb01]KGQ01107.1 hypothetical protein PAAG_12235 [Paracoccidioides lutzii Pb01]
MNNWGRLCHHWQPEHVTSVNRAHRRSISNTKQIVTRSETTQEITKMGFALAPKPPKRQDSNLNGMQGLPARRRGREAK